MKKSDYTYRNRLKKAKDKIPGGLADDKTDKDFNPKTLAEGVKVEMEHTSDKDIAHEIARDHLTENAQYYTRLKAMEAKLEKAKKLNGIIPVGTRPTSGAVKAPKAPSVPKPKMVSSVKVGMSSVSLGGLGKSEDLEKGQNGDWQKEGYSLEVIPKDRKELESSKMAFNPNKHDFTIVAKDPKGEFAGQAHVQHEDTDMYSRYSEVTPRNQRKGLVSGMYEHAEKLSGKKMSEGLSQTPEAKQLWSNPNRKFGNNMKKSEPVEKDMIKSAKKRVEALAKSDLEKAGRCWDGYKPTPGKKAYSDGSCEPIGKSEESDAEPLEKDIIDFKAKKDQKLANMTAQKRQAYEDLKSNMNTPKQSDGRSTDQKISDALKNQPNNPYAQKREDQGVGGYSDMSGQGSGLMDQPSAREKFNSHNERQLSLKVGSAKKKKEAKEAVDKDAFYAANPNAKTMDNLIDRMGDYPETVNYINEMNSKQHDEPYYGNPSVSGLAGYSSGSKHPQPFPHYNVDPQGTLGKEVQDFGHDPLMWMDTKYGAAKKVLDEHKGRPLDIHTRSDLIGHDDYMEKLDPKRHRVFMHALSANKDINRIAMPGTASIKRQLTAASKLREAGHDVTMVHDNIPGFNEAYPQNQLSSVDFAHLVKEHDPKLKISVNNIPESEKSQNFLKHAKKIFGDNNED